jgi:hypothetical protein
MLAPEQGPTGIGAFLSELAHHRRALGLAATALCWTDGPEEVSYDAVWLADEPAVTWGAPTTNGA